MAPEQQEGVAELAGRDRAARHGHAGGDGAAFGGNALQPDQQEHHAERGQQIRHAHVDDEKAVDETDRDADQETRGHRHHRVAVQHHHHIGRGHHGAGGDRADREIEAADHQRGGDAQRQHARNGHRLQDEDRALRRGETAGRHREIGDQPGQQHQEAVADGEAAQAQGRLARGRLRVAQRCHVDKTPARDTPRWPRPATSASRRSISMSVLMCWPTRVCSDITRMRSAVSSASSSSVTKMSVARPAALARSLAAMSRRAAMSTP